jgi:hypothetical protein
MKLHFMVSTSYTLSHLTNFKVYTGIEKLHIDSQKPKTGAETRVGKPGFLQKWFFGLN